MNDTERKFLYVYFILRNKDNLSIVDKFEIHDDFFLNYNIC